MNIRTPDINFNNIQECQYIAIQDNKWKNISQYLRNDWTNCLKSIQELENNIELENKNRIKISRYLRWSQYLVNILFNIYTGVQLIFYALNKEVSYEISFILSAITAIASFSFWAPLYKKSNKYLVEARDLKSLKLLCERIRLKLREILRDGKIDMRERQQIRDMIGEINIASSQIGGFDVFLKILGENDTDNTFNKTKKYQNMFKDVDNMVSQLSNAQNIVQRNVPEIVREYQNLQQINNIHVIP